MAGKIRFCAGLLALLIAPVHGGWEFDRTEAGAGAAIARTVSESPVRLQGEPPRRATLAVRCMGGKLHTFVDFGGVVNVADAEVTHRFDDADSVTETWAIGLHYTTLFSPRPQALARDIRRRHRLAVMTSPYAQPPVLLRFDLTGSAGPVGRVLRACGKTP